MGSLRPTITVDTVLAPKEVVRRVGQALKQPSCAMSGLAAESRLELHVHGAEEHMWSPQLIVEIEPAESGAVLRGRFGPHPSVWTLYVAGYAACLFGALLSVSFAYAQWVMGGAPTALLGLVVVGAVALGLYFLAFWGQRASASQMRQLQDFLRSEMTRLESLHPRAESQAAQLV